MKISSGIYLALALAAVCLPALAQTSNGVEPFEEYGKHLRAAQETTPLTSTLFGDKVSLYSGATQFDVTDVDLPGNSSLPVRFSRRFTIDDRRRLTGNIGGLGDWDIEVPYIDGTFVAAIGWMVQSGNSSSNLRCSVVAPPYTTIGSITAPAYSIWDGDQLHIPGETDEELLNNTESKIPALTDGKTYPWITKSFYRATCGSAPLNGYGGESFVVVSPSGVRYTFNWVVVKDTSALDFQYPNPSGPGTVKGTAARSRIYLLATRVQDRFGNWVTYTYDGSHLTSIQADDGRAISITWSGDVITSASAGSRTWQYGYAADGSLHSVTKPDGSQWIYSVVSGSLQTTRQADGGTPPSYHCQIDHDPNIGHFVYSIQAPSGATGTFTFNYQRNSRSYVPKSCTDVNPNTQYPDVYDFFDNFALVSKSITGAGLTAQNWGYDYGANHLGYITASVPYPLYATTYIPQSSAPLAPDKIVTVSDPSGITTYAFGINCGVNEGRLDSTTTASADGTVMRVVTNSYIDDGQIANEPFPDHAGMSVEPIWKNPMVARLRPVTTQVTQLTQQDGDTYTHQNETFDAFARPTKVKRFNSIVGQPSIEEQTSYYDDVQLWVLGQLQAVTNVATGEIETQNVYDAVSALLKSSAHFGQTRLTYAYDARGQLASFTDGNSNTTALGNYYRGIPRQINYPDNTSQTATVDDYGDITSVTDQEGHATRYTYDAAGWPSEIDYPTGDEQNWLPQTFQFTYVTGAEKGIAGGHWRRTVATGNAIDITYFDAMLRPLFSDRYIANQAGSDIITVAGFDWRGLQTFASYPVGSAASVADVTQGTHTTYDVLQRPARVVQNSELGDLVGTTQYLSGARVQTTDPKNNVTTSTYQVFDEPSTQAVIEIQAPEGVTQTIARDIYGNPTTITQSGLYGTETDSVTKRLYYDSYHRLCRTTEPESGSTISNYDGANNVQSTASGLTISGSDCGSAQASALTTFGYDPMNRVKTILPPAGTQSTTYHYTLSGDMDQAESGNSLWAAHYNARGMMTDETLTLTGQGPMTLGYAHNAYGGLDHLTYPDGLSVSYAPDALGRPTQVGGYAHGVQYFPNGQVAGFIYADGTAYVAEQNARQLLKSFSYGTVSSLTVSEDLGYDPNANILTVQDLVDNKRSKTFGYDGLNRLTSAVAPQLWGNESYTYDPLNNLRARLSAGQTNVYTYDPSNRLTSIVRSGSAIASFGYDNRGNETGKNGNALLFDQKNQLTQIPAFASYQYDAAGRRTVKTPANGGGSTYSFYNHAGQLLYQDEPGISKSTDFIYLGSHLIADKEHLQLAAPGAVSFDANPNNGSYTVGWGAVTGAASYLLQEQLVGGGSWTTVYSGGAASTTLSGRAGGSYVYQVKACSGSACGPWTLSATLGVRPTLPVVSVPSGTVNGAYTVSWTAPASASAYQVQERVDGGSWTTIASSTPATSISRPGTTSGSYTYQVAASNSYGTRGWASSGAVTVDTTYGVLPASPASLAVPAASNTGSATLSWAATTLTTSYTLQQSGNGGASWANAYQGTSTSAAVSGLPDGPYSYRVQSCNTYGCSPWQAGSTTLVVTHPPTVAPALNATPDSSNGSYTVSWGGVAGALSYLLQEQVNGGGWSTVQNTAAIQWSASGRGTGTYGHRVQACNVGGCGPWSATTSLNVLLPPPTPASISVPATSNGLIAVSWAASPTATIYGLDQSVNGGGWAQVYANAPTATQISVAASGSYQYRAYACNGSGCSGYATSAAVAVTLAPTGTPSLSVPAISANGSYTVSWSAVDAATTYILQEQLNGGGWSTSQNSGATSEAFSGKGTGYYGYRVQGCNGGGCGPWSAVGTIAVAQPPTAPPSVTAPSYVHGTAYTVSWSASSGSTSYNVRRINTDTGASAIIASTASTNVGIAAPISSQTLQYAVQACNANGCSGFTDAPNTTYTERKGAPQIVTPPAQGLGGVR